MTPPAFDPWGMLAAIRAADAARISEISGISGGADGARSTAPTATDDEDWTAVDAWLHGANRDKRMKETANDEGR